MQYSPIHTSDIMDHLYYNASDPPLHSNVTLARLSICDLRSRYCRGCVEWQWSPNIDTKYNEYHRMTPQYYTFNRNRRNTNYTTVTDTGYPVHKTGYPVILIYHIAYNYDWPTIMWNSQRQLTEQTTLLRRFRASKPSDKRQLNSTHPLTELKSKHEECN